MLKSWVLCRKYYKVWKSIIIE